MATETANKNKVFQITDRVKKEGYSGEIGGAQLSISPQVYGEGYDPRTNTRTTVVKEKAQVYVNDTPMKRDHFLDLNNAQIHELAIAGVIELNEDQGKKYREYLKANK